MAKCVIVSGTRVCEDGPAKYRLSGARASKPFPRLSRAQKQALRPILASIRAMGEPRGKADLIAELINIVTAVKWTGTHTANSADIEGVVRLLLADAVKKLDANFTLVAYEL